MELTSILELRNALEVSEAVILAAKMRKESRGSHHRNDYPHTDKKYATHILVKEFQKGFFKLEFEDNSLINRVRNLVLNN